jgi:hypothetical protein
VTVTGNGVPEVVAYEPGVCNIGPAEIARRRRAGHLGLVATAVTLAVLLVTGAPAWTRLMLALPAGAAVVGYLQAALHFCAGFGAQGVFNFGSLGTVQNVVDPKARAADRRRSLEIAFVSLVVGLAVGLAATLL